MPRTCSLTLALSLLTFSLLGGCGQTGSLYRAEDKAQEATTPEGATESENGKKRTTAPAPQSQKVPPSPAGTSMPADPTPAPPAVDPARPATPPPPGN